MDVFRTQLESVNLSGAIRIGSLDPSGKLVVPQEVKLEQTHGEMWIKYRFPIGGKTRSPKGALTNFLMLAGEKTSCDQILKFAQEWGVLLLCEHNKVAFHSPYCIPQLEEPIDGIHPYHFENLTDASQQHAFRQNLALLDIWFKEPVSVWLQYACRFRALIRIFLSLRGDIRGDISKEWAVMREIVFTFSDGSALPLIQKIESVTGVPTHKLPLDTQCSILKTLLSTYMKESNLSLHLDWVYKDTRIPSPNLAIQYSLRTSYQDVNMFPSDYLTLFSVIVAKCITALGPSPFLRVCNCTGCPVHNGNCQELITVSADPGRPPVYCPRCKPYIRQQQKSASRMKRRMERSNQHE